MRSAKFRLFISSTTALRRAASAVAIASVLAVSAAPAIAQQISSREAIELQNQIMDLRQQLNQLQSSGGGQNLAPPSASPAPSGGENGGLTAQLLERVATLEQQQRDMRGQIDQLTNDLQQKTDALNKQIGDMSFAMQNGKGGKIPAESAPAPSMASGDSAPASVPAPQHQTPDALIKGGNDALIHRDYAQAQSAATAALASAKGSQKVDAQFLLAQSLAGQKQYKQSAVAYYDAYNRAPHGARAPDALLGVSATLLALGDKHSACEALNKLKTEVPNPGSRVRAAQMSFKARAGCH